MPDNKNHGVSYDTHLMIGNAKSLQRVAKELQQNKPKPPSDRLLWEGTFLAVPVLSSLAIEIALKAWQCRERDGAPDKIHDLLTLFETLNPETQEMLEARMRKVSPHSIRAADPSTQNLNPDVQEMFAAVKHPLRRVLCSHNDANVHWRFIHERPNAWFATAEIDRALDTIISTYEETWGRV